MLLGEAFEEVGGLGGWLGLGCGGEGGNFRFEDRADVEREGPGGGERARTVGDEEVVGEVEEALGLVRIAEGGEAFGGSGPVEGGGGGGGDGGVVGVGVEGAVSAEGEDDVGAELADALEDVGGQGGEGCEFQAAVLVLEHLVVADAEDVAGGSELGAAELGELGIGGVGGAVGSGLAVGETEDAGVDAPLGGEGESSTEGEAFVVGVGGDAEQS